MAPIFVQNGLKENGVHVGGIVYGGHSLAFKVKFKFSCKITGEIHVLKRCIQIDMCHE